MKYSNIVSAFRIVGKQTLKLKLRVNYFVVYYLTQYWLGNIKEKLSDYAFDSRIHYVILSKYTLDAANLSFAELLAGIKIKCFR